MKEQQLVLGLLGAMAVPGGSAAPSLRPQGALLCGPPEPAQSCRDLARAVATGGSQRQRVGPVAQESDCSAVDSAPVRGGPRSREV